MPKCSMLNVSRELSQVSITHDAGDARVTDDSGSTRSFASSRNWAASPGCSERDPQPPIPVGSRRAWSPSLIVRRRVGSRGMRSRMPARAPEMRRLRARPLAASQCVSVRSRETLSSPCKRVLYTPQRCHRSTTKPSRAVKAADRIGDQPVRESVSPALC